MFGLGEITVRSGRVSIAMTRLAVGQGDRSGSSSSSSAVRPVSNSVQQQEKSKSVGWQNKVREKGAIAAGSIDGSSQNDNSSRPCCMLQLCRVHLELHTYVATEHLPPPRIVATSSVTFTFKKFDWRSYTSIVSYCVE